MNATTHEASAHLLDELHEHRSRSCLHFREAQELHDAVVVFESLDFLALVEEVADAIFVNVVKANANNDAAFRDGGLRSMIRMAAWRAALWLRPQVYVLSPRV